MGRREGVWEGEGGKHRRRGGEREERGGGESRREEVVEMRGRARWTTWSRKWVAAAFIYTTMWTICPTHSHLDR